MADAVQSAIVGLPQDVHVPARTRLGRGFRADLPKLVSEFGSRGVLVHGAALRACERERFDSVSVRCFAKSAGEPNLQGLDALRGVCRAHRAEWVVGMGGGSVIDLAKAAAGLQGSDRPSADFHQGAKIRGDGIPFIAVPTTAGAGSEATVVSVLTDTDRGLKKSMRHPSFMPDVVVLDPDLLAGTPRHVMAHSGLDALTQGIESYLSSGATEFTRMLALGAIDLIAGALEAAVADPSGAAADAMLSGSYLAGLALSHSRLGLVHGLAHPLGLRFDLPHGQICALALPHVLRFNRTSCPDAFAVLAAALGEDPERFARNLLVRLDVTFPLKGQTVPDDEAYLEEVLRSGSTAANPRPVEREDVRAVTGALFADSE